MADEMKTCPNDCTKCTPQQRLLCAAQFSMMSIRRMEAIEERMERMEDLQKKLSNDDSGVFNPVSEEGVV